MNIKNHELVAVFFSSLSTLRHHNNDSPPPSYEDTLPNLRMVGKRQNQTIRNKTKEEYFARKSTPSVGMFSYPS
jgi:hypothetical protein